MLAASVYIAASFLVAPHLSHTCTCASTSLVRAPAALACGHAILERAPPAPPPSTGDGGDSGGGGGSNEFLRLLTSAEQADVLSDWIARTNIYKMTDDAQLVRAQVSALRQLEDLQSFDIAEPGESGRRMVLGLFDDVQVLGIASAEVSRKTGLIVTTLCVYPAELNNPDSTVALRLVHALHLLADAIETPIAVHHVCQSAFLYGDQQFLEESPPDDQRNE